MFSFWKKKRPSHSDGQHLTPLSRLTDETLLSSIKHFLEDMGPRGCALFVIGYQYISILYATYVYAWEKDNEAKYSGNWELFADWCGVSWSQQFNLTGHAREIGTRRYAYYFFAASLKALHVRAKVRENLWDQVAILWTLLLNGAKLLPQTLAETCIWPEDHLQVFKDQTTPDLVEKYCLAHLMPPQIRRNAVIEAWEERELPDAVKQLLDETKKLIDGE